ncbi:MAG: PEGA domain-containing protein, partial [Deltaproteobacteria bacterium]|nr:PEGA domain-containing protein [Deltaproteobacteria bacterium]
YSLSEAGYLGWITITSNPPEAQIYIDKKEAGVFQKTPYSGNLAPGKHTIWITKPGYSEYKTEIEIIRGNDKHKVHADLKGSEVGYLNVRGPDITAAAIYLDGKLLCERGPCRKPVQEGSHTVTFKRNGYKPYKRTIVVQQKTETTVTARLAEEPGRADAITAYVIGAAFLGLGVYAGLEANSIQDEVEADIAAAGCTGSEPCPILDSADPRLSWDLFKGGKFWAVTADAAYGLGAITIVTAIYYTFRDKGAPSTGDSDVKALALEPTLGPDFSGVALGGRF